MTPEKAFEIITKALELAQKQGAFTLSDAKLVIVAIDTLQPEIIKDNVKTEDKETVEK